MPIKFRWPQDINAIRFGATLVWGAVNGIITTIQGTSPLALVNAVAGRIKSLVQYGKCTTVDDEIYCNNGKLVIVDDELPSGYKRLLGITFDGNFRYETGEALTGDDDVTMTLDNLSTSGKNIFGSYNGANDKNFSLYIYGSASSGSYFRYGDQLKRPKYGTGKRTITFGKSGTSGFAGDSDVTPDEFTTPANVYIGMLPNSSSAAYIGDIIGSIIVSNRLEWIPCERESDGTIGYYEKYNGNFLEPVGSGTPVSLGYDDSHLNVLSVDGTAEVLTIGTQTATAANLFSTGAVHDEQDIISGTVTRRCEAVISDGTTPSGRYIGTVGEGNIIVKARETGYEGDVATFEATEAEPLNGLTVNVEPIQDLHGYDNPWPAGGGKNKLNSGFCLNRTSRGLRTVVNADGSITLTGTAETGTRYWNSSDNLGLTLAAGTYTLSPSNLRLEKSGGPVYGTFTLSEETTFSNVYWGGFTSGEVVNTIVYPQLEIGSTATAYAPYENICPISGRTSATVTRTGINWYPVSIGADAWQSFNNGSSSNNDGELIVSMAARMYSGVYSRPEAQIRKLSGCSVTASYSVYIKASAATEIFIGYANKGNRKAQLTTEYQRFTFDNFAFGTDNSFNIYNGTANAVTVYLKDFQFELGSTASAYEPYQGNTYTIQLGDTVYGGTLDVTAGKMMVDRAKFAPIVNSLQSINSYGIANFSGSFSANNMPSAENSNKSKLAFLCNCLPTQMTPIASTQNPGVSLTNSGTFYVRLPESEATTVADANAWITAQGMEICYMLESPIEIILTPTQIETLLGTNNIWSDAGAVKAYVADAELIEHVTRQPMRTAEGSNAVSVTSAVDPVQLEIDYYKGE